MLKDPPAASGTEGDGDAETRPPWHWIGFGTVAVFGAWVPLSYLAELVRGRATAAWIGAPGSAEETARAIASLSAGDRAKLGAIMVLTHGGGLAIAAFAGGYLVGRYGGERVGVREAALAGLMASLVAVVLGWAGISWVPLVTMAIATGGAALGGRRGTRGRLGARGAREGEGRKSAKSG